MCVKDAEGVKKMSSLFLSREISESTTLQNPKGSLLTSTGTTLSLF